MFRTSILRLSPSSAYWAPIPALSAVPASASRRAFASAAIRFNSLKAKPADEAAGRGAEGLHRKDTAAATTEQLTKADITNTVPPAVNGDWVLFHPVYTQDELRSVQVMHRTPENTTDKLASMLVKTVRRGFDIVTGYKHKEIPQGSNMSIQQLRKGGYIMDEAQWLSRIFFLETIAGVPGMVAATLRHLRSLRLMKRDGGWIHTLLEEAENERMHLMTFMAVRKPGLFLRALVLGAQGVFYNIFFFSYLISPRSCHRFVGYLEEEAVRTYTNCIKEIEAGRLPAWKDHPAPDIAKDYWRLPSDAKLLDVIYAVRSDESTHRFVNHSLANLNHKTDVNPFALREPEMTVKGMKLEFKRDEAERFVHDSHKLLEQGPKHN